MNYYATEKLGPKQSLTPEGFLLCEDVPIARIGEMIYGPGETPITVGEDGVAHIFRDEEQVFRPETVASFNGKPVVNGHPMEDVTPLNWRDVTVGFVLNVRRGAGANADCLLGDLVLTDRAAIEAVRNGLREVSCGYDADYIQIAPGKGKQINIIGNHLALVEAGRCGPRCAIGDQISSQELHMTVKERLKKLFADKDEKGFTAVLDELPEAAATHVHVHTVDRDKEEEEEDKDKKTMDAIAKDLGTIKDGLSSMDSRLKKVEDRIAKDEKEEEEEEKEKKKAEDEAAAAAGNRKLDELGFEAPPGTGDAAKKAKDSAYLADSWQESVALAEIISPGVGIPTFDAKAEPMKTYDALCQFRRTVLDLAYNQPETRVFIDGLRGTVELKQHTCDSIRTMFKAVGNFKKTLNSRAADNSGGGAGPTARVKSIADLNKLNAEFYAGK